MRNPTSQEKSCRGFGQVKRIEQKGPVMNKVPRVIEHHDDHHDAAQQIDRVDPSSR